MDFSLAVKLADLDDFLRPSQECMVVEQKQERPRLLKETSSSKEATVESLKAATVSLADCLACSGCVTTAEAVLIDSHNYQTLLNILEVPAAAGDEEVSTAYKTPAYGSDDAESGGGDRKERPVVILSLSGVSEAALMAYYGVDDRDAFYEWIRDALLQHGIRETFNMDAAEILASVRRGTSGLSSHCPGVVLYAEKSGTCENINIGPPSQIWQGALIKTMSGNIRDFSWQRLAPLHYYGRQLRLSFQQMMSNEESSRKRQSPAIYHVTVNSCLDKKLESVRPEFAGLVELGLTTHELIEVLKHFALTYSEPRHILRNRMWDVCHRIGHLYTFGSYRFSLLRANGGMAAEAVNRANEPEMAREASPEIAAVDHCSRDSLNYTTARGYNMDHTILTSAVFHGRIIQIATGLRNLKNFCGGSKTPASGALELLACPKGCFSGVGHAEIFSVPGKRQQAETIYADVQRWIPVDVDGLADDVVRRWGRPIEYVIAPLEKTNNNKW